MIKEIHFKNWKSFREAVLMIDPLTVLIGANASGKSNALDGFRFLNRIAMGMDLTSALVGDASKTGIRGGVEWASLKPNKEFTLDILFGVDDHLDYLYSITVQTIPQVLLKCESLKRIKYTGKHKTRTYQINLFWTDPLSVEVPAITARLYNEHRGKSKDCSRSKSILQQLHGQALRQEIAEGINYVVGSLANIFILDPAPNLMRGFSAFSMGLEENASNIAGVIAALAKEKKDKVISTISKYANSLPEKDIKKVWAEPVGLFQTDAMLYCEEKWVDGNGSITVDARSMSDGTLRFLAVLTALLTRPENSQIIIEEVDNGLHPSRAGLLLGILDEIGQERKIDVLITTHNPALLDELGSAMIPFIVVANRNTENGTSELRLLEDIESLPKMLASGTLGGITAKGLIEKSLKQV